MESFYLEIVSLLFVGESPVVLDTNPFATRVGVIIQLVNLTFARGPSCASCPRNSGNKNE